MRILLLTDMPPCNNFTAGIVIQHLYRFLIESGHQVACFGVITPTLDPDIPQDILQVMPYCRLDKPRENWGTLRYGFMASLLGNNYIAAVTLARFAKQAAAFAKKQDSQLIWSIIQGQTMIKLVKKVASRSGLPYVAQVWDPPEWWLNENRFDRFTFQAVITEFGQLLYHSKACLAASWAMAAEYHQLYQANCIPVVPGLDEQAVIAPAKIHYSEAEFIIAFAGQLYAQAEFAVLLEALNQLGWTYGGKKIRIVLYGASFPPKLEANPNILLKGWVDQANVLSELAAANLLYCPYGFSENFEKIARLSFPSKLTSYLKTRTPVLMHGPVYASPSIFIRENSAAYVCNSQNPDEVAQTLRGIIDDPKSAQVGIRGYQAYQKHLTFVTMKRNFFQALGI